MSEESSRNQELQEYETQLEEVHTLLQASPEDPTLLSLKADLDELISITRQALGGAVGAAATGESDSPKELDNSRSVQSSSFPIAEYFSEDFHSRGVAFAQASDPIDVAKGPQQSNNEPPKKKVKKVKDFEVPQHLIVLDTDTEAEAHKKRRALKALKSKWRERKKEAETEQKQKSWQSFQKKAKVGKDSMFSTQDGDSKVGVVTTGRALTQSGERKRHNAT